MNEQLNDSLMAARSSPEKNSLSQSNVSLNSNVTIKSNHSTASTNSSYRRSANILTNFSHRVQSLYRRFSNTHTQLSDLDIQVLSKLTSYSPEEIREWHEKFLADCPHGYMTKKQFVQMYRQLFPKGDAERFAKHVYRAFDVDKSGFVDFREFITGLRMTSTTSSPRQKLEWTFNVFDIDGNGYITRKECCEVISSIIRLNQNSMSHEDIVNTEDLAKKTNDENF